MSLAGAEHMLNVMDYRIRLNIHLHLEIEIGDPVDQVEETKCSGEEDACIRVYLGDADVQPAMPPGSRAAVFETAEEAGAVLAI